MSEKIEARGSLKVASSGHKESFAVLNSCFVDGDAEQRSRERQTRRRALGISVGLQSTALMALLIIPLIGRTERIALGPYTPIPPYVHPHGDPQIPPRPNGSARPVCSPCYSANISPTIPTHDPNPTGNESEPNINGFPDGRDGNREGIPILDPRPTPPREELRREPQTKRILVGHLEPAMLVRRIEPLYPTLPRHLGRSGIVELHAIISTDGSIQSLEVVNGDPLFVQSALEAVRQWRYKPTILNGVPVEVDTHITVIYSMQR
jgi:periplasmic protein TonB